MPSRRTSPAEIRQLLHGLHTRGALATAFIAGHGDDVVGLLNGLAGANDGATGQ